jgi:hypothetical protein
MFRCAGRAEIGTRCCRGKPKRLRGQRAVCTRRSRCRTRCFGSVRPPLDAWSVATASPTPPIHRLPRTRLGKAERWLLRAAPRVDRLSGFLLSLPNETPSARASVLRALRKLEKSGLVDVKRLPFKERARDSRRERPLYRNGRFWRHPDQTRRQIVYRPVIWISPLGEGVRKVFARELEHNLSIRWTKSKLKQVGRVAATQRLFNESSRHHWVQAQKGFYADGDETLEPSEEARPAAVRTEQDLERWRSATALAVRSHPNAGSEKRWLAARALFESPDALRQERNGPAAPPSGGSRRTPLCQRHVRQLPPLD